MSSQLRYDFRKIALHASGVIALTLAGTLAYWTFGPGTDTPAWARFRASQERRALEQLVRDDDACGTARVLAGRAISSEQALEIVFSSTSRFPAESTEDAALRETIAALLSGSAEAAVEALESVRARGDAQAADFYRALILAGWIESLRPARLDLTTAHALMKDLRERDARNPDGPQHSLKNGAFGLFEAALKLRMGSRPDEILEVLTKTFATGHLETYQPALSRALMLRAFANSSTFLVGAELQARLPAPSLQPIWRDLLPLISEHGNPRIVEAAVKFSRSTLRLARLQRRNPEGWTSAIETARSSAATHCERRELDQLIAAETRLFRRQIASAK